LAWKRSWVQFPSAPPFLNAPSVWHNCGCARRGPSLRDCSSRCEWREVEILQSFRCDILSSIERAAIATVIALIFIIALVPAAADIRPLVKPSAEHQPQVQLFIVPVDATGTASAALTYTSRAPSKSEAEQDLNEIARLTLWRISDAQFSSGGDSKPDRPAMTSVEFTAANALPDSTGGFPIEPLVIALKRYKSVELVFAMRSDFRFKGLKDYEDKNVRVSLRSSGQTYTYDISVKRSDFDTLGLPTIMEPAAAPPQPTKKPRSLLWPLLIAVVIGVFVAAAGLRARKKRKLGGGT
jgi:hypothetical protein